MKPAGGLKKTYIDPRDLPQVERATLRRIFACLEPYRRDALLVLGAITLSALLGTLPPLFIKAIIDRALPEKRIDLLLMLCAGMVLGPLCSGLVGVAQKYLSATISERVMFDMRTQLFALAKNGLYAQLYREQFRSQIEGAE